MNETIELDSFDAPTYTVKGKAVPRVSTILNSLYSFYGVSRETMDFAAERGKHIHLATHYIDENDFSYEDADPQIKPYLDAYRQFKYDVRPEWTGIERRVYSAKYGYAGTLDRVGVLHGLRGTPEAVVDIKAVHAISPITALQTAAYEMADRNNNRMSARKRYALQLKSDGTYKLEKFDDPGDFSVFLCALTMHNWRARNGL
ncbi:MAG: hypothetical protein OEQ39_05665 [Gammaproteobacteria bacterium]|nr:hypothetical protein [Gammaproteobacteria bacterium]